MIDWINVIILTGFTVLFIWDYKLRWKYDTLERRIEDRFTKLEGQKFVKDEKKIRCIDCKWFDRGIPGCNASQDINVYLISDPTVCQPCPIDSYESLSELKGANLND